MTLSPNIILGNDYVTAYFADQIWPKTLKDHRKRWDEAAKTGDPTPRSRLAELAKVYFRLRPAAADGDPTAMEELCARAASALGYPVYWSDQSSPVPAAVAMMRGGVTYDVPGIAVVPDDDEPPDILVIQAAEFTSDPSVLITKDARPTRLPHRYGDPEKVVEGIESIPALINFVFTLEHAPRWVLVVAGGALALVDHRPWLDGKWLGANVDDILSNNDSTSGGELDQLAGWFSTFGTIPDDDGASLLDAAVDGSQRQAVGVSELLRDAVRAGVEAIANEVLYDRRERRKRSVFGEQGGVTVDAADLAREAIRWMYRLVVLLYAEARPGIGILPTTADGTTLYERYEAGYGLERLRQLALVELETEAARNGTHIHQSLNVLFGLVNDGHRRPAATEISADGSDTWTGIEFEGLNSRLFGPRSCPDIDAAYLRDHVLQKVIAGLCFTPGERGKGRQAVSYANLEINQLGAVYEGLMAYTGFIALEDRNEVAARTKGDNNDGVARSADPSRGSWTIPVTEADRYPDNVFVTETNLESGETRRVVHEKGSFVFRLAGRDRARSASFYTPSVLTEFTVRHALEEWQANHPDLTAADVLQMTILEPALGSGAFANEACDQAAELYLRLREAETGETVPAEDRPTELRRLRAHFAINQTYGVDLNDTGVELAEVSLWLNSMHPGLAAPPLSHRLRRGNSLIGCTRSIYTEDQVAKQPWKGDVFPPTDKPLADHPLGTTGLGIHHFLLPGEGWGVAAKTGRTTCRNLAPEWCDEVWEWRKQIHKKLSKAQLTRASALADKIESLWASAAVDVESHLNAQNRRIAIWNDAASNLRTGNSTRFRDPNGPYQRLKSIMDAWCALWMWAPEHRTNLPSLDQWLDALEYLCGSRRADAEGRLFGEHTRVTPSEPEHSDMLFDTETTYNDQTTVAEARQRWPWLAKCDAISRDMGFLHWPLEFPSVLSTGGFHLIVGNPPWTKLSRTDTDVLLDADPLAAIERWSIDQTVESASILTSPEAASEYLTEFGKSEGTSSYLSSSAIYPLVSDSLTNLYLSFMERLFPMVGSAMGLLHQESFYEDEKAAALTATVYLLLRRHWHFVNEDDLFSDVGNTKEFGVHIYGAGEGQSVDHLYACKLLQPHMVDRSLDGEGSDYPPPGKKRNGEWDLRPHPTRIMVVNDSTLQTFWALGTPAVPARAARCLRFYSSVELDFLSRLFPRAEQIRSLQPWYSNGLHESSDAVEPNRITEKPKARMLKQVATPDSFSHAVIKGPNIHVANPFHQEPNPGYSHAKDNRVIDASDLTPDFVPRTVLQQFPTPAAARIRLDAKSRWSASKHWRVAWPEKIGLQWARCLQPVLIPPGTIHGHSMMSLALESAESTARVHAFMCSTVAEYIIRVIGSEHLGEPEIGSLPRPTDLSDINSRVWSNLLSRTLRLNCLTIEYSELWAACWLPEWRENFTLFPMPTGSEWSALGPTWDHTVPIRSDLDRWRTLIEVDALVSVLLNLDPSQVETVGRLHVGLLEHYEHKTVYDATGHRVSGEFHNRGGRQRVNPAEEYRAAVQGEFDSVLIEQFTPPFSRFERWEIFHAAYQAGAGAMG